MFAAGTAVAATGYSKALGDDATTVSESSALSTTTPLPDPPTLLGPPQPSTRVAVPSGAITAIPGRGNNIAHSVDDCVDADAVGP